MEKPDVPQELRKYIFEDIVPKYAEFDKAHREDHALTVIRSAFRLAEALPEWLDGHPEAEDIWHTPVDDRILLVAAACHDLGLVNGRDNHHLDSGTIIRKDRRLREWFEEDEIELMAQAAEDHRASGKSAPRSIYGMLVAEADRVIDGETIIRRTIQFGQKHYPELDHDGHIGRAMTHLREKYGRGGYLKLWVPWSENGRRLSALQDIIADSRALQDEVERVYATLQA